MKRIFYPALLLLLVTACNTNTESKMAEPTPAPDLKGYEVSYSSSFEMGDSKNVETIAALWKAWDNNSLPNEINHFADSVTFYSADGMMMAGPRDEAMKNFQEYRDTYSSVNSTINAIMPLRSTDKDENWVCIWGVERKTDKNGNTDSTFLQETWRFTKDGKVDLVYQFAAKPPAPPSN